MSEKIPALETFGRRIMIMGPSNSGKSTLAVALGQRLGIPAVHVDLMRHWPDSDWQPRPDVDFHDLHERAIAEPEWAMDGNYGELVPQRLSRATGIIVIDSSLLTRYRRFFWRSTVQSRTRLGGLESGRDSVKWDMVRWLWVSRHSGRKYRRIARESGLPHILCHGRRELNALYKGWGLTRPDQAS